MDNFAKMPKILECIFVGDKSDQIFKSDIAFSIEINIVGNWAVVAISVLAFYSDDWSSNPECPNLKK